MKKLFCGKRKIILILLSLIISILVVFLIINISRYHPRKISRYIKQDIKDCVKIEIEDYDLITNNPIEYEIRSEDQETFLNSLLNIKVTPKKTAIKSTTTYKIKLTFKNGTYILTGFVCNYNNGEKTYLFNYSYSIGNLVSNYYNNYFQTNI